MSCRGRCKRKNKKRLGVTVNGPISGKKFIIQPDKQHYFFATPTNPYYCGAYYTLVNRLTPLGEQIAIFSYNLERIKSCQKE